MNNLRLTTLALAIALTQGCAFTPTVRQVNREAEDMAVKAKATIEGGREAVTKNNEAALAPPTKFWLGARPIADANRTLSHITRQHIVMKESYATLGDVIDALSRDVGIPTRLTRDPIPNAREPISLNQEGEAADILDTIANRYNLYWSENQGVVYFSITKTQTFRIRSVAASATSMVNVSGDQNSGGSGGGASTGTQSANFASQNLDSFKAVEEITRSMLSPVGRLVSSPAAGTIVVSDVPEKLDQIAKVIEEANASFGQQIFVDLRVVLVSQKDGSSFGLDWGAVFNSINNKYNLGLVVPSNITSTAGIFSMSIPANATGGAGQYAGTSLLLKSLEEYATVTQVTSAPLLTLNNKPTQFRRGRTLSYITATATQTANVGTTTGAQLARERLGFSLNVLPHAMKDNTIVMQTGISIKLLNQLRVVTQGSGLSQTTSEAPDTDDLDFGTQSITKSGDTIVLAGFEQVTGNSNQQGLGFAANSLLGGERGTRQKDIVVFILTPTIVATQ